MWVTFKVFIEFVTILLLSYVLVFWPQSMWGLSSLTRDRTCIHPALESLNHWTAREVPGVGHFCLAFDSLLFRFFLPQSASQSLKGRGFCSP